MFINNQLICVIKDTCLSQVTVAITLSPAEQFHSLWVPWRYHIFQNCKFCNWCQPCHWSVAHQKQMNMLYYNKSSPHQTTCLVDQHTCQDTLANKWTSMYKKAWSHIFLNKNAKFNPTEQITVFHCFLWKDHTALQMPSKPLHISQAR